MSIFSNMRRNALCQSLLGLTALGCQKTPEPTQDISMLVLVDPTLDQWMRSCEREDGTLRKVEKQEFRYSDEFTGTTITSMTNEYRVPVGRSKPSEYARAIPLKYTEFACQFFTYDRGMTEKLGKPLAIKVKEIKTWKFEPEKFLTDFHGQYDGNKIMEEALSRYSEDLIVVFTGLDVCSKEEKSKGFTVTGTADGIANGIPGKACIVDKGIFCTKRSNPGLVVAHEIGHCLGAEHLAECPENAYYLMHPCSPKSYSLGPHSVEQIADFLEHR